MAKMPKPTTVDVETFGIESRPSYPPDIVGVSIKKWGKKPRYYAFNHPTANNATREEAAAAVAKAYETPDGVIFHNAKFDLDVIETHLGISPPPWDHVHDTMFLLFLHDPHAKALGLKPSAKRLLGMEPEERDAVADWLLTNQPFRERGVRITRAQTGKYIAYAPGEIVGPYANGDVDRTEALFRHLWPVVVDAGMVDAYDRERRLLPVLLDMERRGVRVDLARLRDDVARYRAVHERLRVWACKRLMVVDTEFNLGSDDQLRSVLREQGLVDESKMDVTKTGKLSVAGKSLEAGLSDRVLSRVLQYWSQLSTCLATFMEPWLATAERSSELIFTNWNQTRGGAGGTRTGRMSSSDTSFQNIPKEFGPLFAHEADRETDPKRRADLRKIKAPFSLPPLPLCRGYVVPHAARDVLIGRDYSQQEPRILGHFEGGALMEQYQAEPWIDFHDNARDRLEEIYKRPFARKPVKNINLGLIYGQGVPSLAEKNGESIADTKMLKDSILNMYPGLKDMYRDMKTIAQNGEPIRTWGGRVYFCEPPIIHNGRIIKFDYKMVNVLIQGSAADCTKEAVARFVERAGERWATPEERRSTNDHVRLGLAVLDRLGWKLILLVHDEVVLSAPASGFLAAMDHLRDCMESVEFDVRILSEGAWSAENWASMADWDKKGKVVGVAPVAKNHKAA